MKNIKIQSMLKHKKRVSKVRQLTFLLNEYVRFSLNLNRISRQISRTLDRMDPEACEIAYSVIHIMEEELKNYDSTFESKSDDSE